MGKKVSTIVGVHLNEIIGCNLEGFLDLLEELVLADYEEEERYRYVLSDISYEKALLACSDLIGIKVTATLEEVE